MPSSINPKVARQDAEQSRAEQTQNVKDALWNATSDQPWGRAFWNALESAQVPESLAAGDAGHQAHTADPFVGVSGADRQAVKDDLFNALGHSALAPEAWNRLWTAGLVPGSQPDQVPNQENPFAPAATASQAAESHQAGVASWNSPGAPQGGPSLSAGPQPATMTAATAAAGQAGAHATAQAQPATNGPAGQQPAPQTQPATNAGQAGQQPATQAPPATNAAATTPAATLPGTAAAPASRSGEDASGVLSVTSLRDKMTRLLAARMGQTSGRYLGRDDSFKDPAHPKADDAKRWDDAKLQQLATGIATAHQFYANIPLEDFANLVMAEGSQESSGDTTLNVNNGDPGAGWGYLQVTPQSVVADYLRFGAPIKAPDGSTVVDPNKPIDLGNVAQNVALWGWYTRNALAAGQSLNEKMHPEWHDQPSPVTRDFGNAEYDWLGGPHNDRHNDPEHHYADYYNRIRDYFVQSGLGTQADFDRLLATPVSAEMAGLKR